VFDTKKGPLQPLLQLGLKRCHRSQGKRLRARRILLYQHLHHLHELAYIAIMNFSLISLEPMLPRAQMPADISVIMHGAAAVHSITS
jgi:hypothetical protein